MVKDPRPHKPGSSEPDEALDLLRALARTHAGNPPRKEPAPLPPVEGGDEKLDSLRALAERLDLQLRSSPPPADLPGPPPPLPPSPATHERPRRDPWQTLRREWHALVAALPEAASLVPRFARPQLIFIGVSVAVLALAAIGAIVGVQRSPPSAPATAPVVNQTGPPTEQVVPPIASAPAPATRPADIPTITKAMSDCDAAAVLEPGSLYFLITPLVPTKPGDDATWGAIALQTLGSTILLLSAKDALDGLRDGRLALRPGRYTFAVLDPDSGASYLWNSATGVSRLSRPVAATVKTLKLGFDFSATQSGPQWSNEFKRDVGACYWVSALVRG
jgi:hypothetical protein